MRYLREQLPNHYLAPRSRALTPKCLKHLITLLPQLSRKGLRWELSGSLGFLRHEPLLSLQGPQYIFLGSTPWPSVLVLPSCKLGIGTWFSVKGRASDRVIACLLLPISRNAKWPARYQFMKCGQWFGGMIMGTIVRFMEKESWRWSVGRCLWKQDRKIFVFHVN